MKEIGALSLPEGSDSVLQCDSAYDDRRAKLQQRTLGSNGASRPVDCWQLIHDRQPSQLEGVITIRLAFDLAPPPRFAVGVGDEVWLLEFVAKIGQPPGGRAKCLHGDESMRVVAVLVSNLDACHCLELSKVEYENVHGRVNLSTCELMSNRPVRSARGAKLLPIRAPKLLSTYGFHGFFIRLLC